MNVMVLSQVRRWLKVREGALSTRPAWGIEPSRILCDDNCSPYEADERKHSRPDDGREINGKCMKSKKMEFMQLKIN